MDAELKIEVFEPDADEERLNELTQNLRHDLLELDVESVSSVSAGEAPIDSKGIELAAVGALVLVLKSSVELATQVVTAVRSWLQRGPSSERTLRLTLNGQTLELSAATDAQQQQLVDEFVKSVASGP